MRFAKTRWYGTDCEGPLSRDDNAFGLSQKFIPNGGEFFRKLSAYDDFLADVIQMPGYKAGDTLGLLAPFLRAYGVTDEMIRGYSARHILLVPGAKKMLEYVRSIMPCFMISTSYAPYIKALCDAIGFPFGDAYCTELELNKYRLGEEAVNLKKLKQAIGQMPVLEWPEGAEAYDDLSPEMHAVATELDRTFWEIIPGMEVAGTILSGVRPVGGFEKAHAMQDAAKKHGLNLWDAMYAGDSITDVMAFKLMQKNGGLGVAVNGNGYAIRAAEIAVITGNVTVMQYIARAFRDRGKSAAMRLVKQGCPETLAFPSNLEKMVLEDCPGVYVRARAITDGNRDELTEKSEAFRKTVRGEGVGRLG